MQNVEQIFSAVNESVEAERREYATDTKPEPTPAPEPEPDAEPEAATQKTDVLGALRRNEDGDAELFIQLHRERFLYDHAAGRCANINCSANARKIAQGWTK